ncbi:MAG: FAD-binding oxidoreductase, partial [Phycisphaerales bacterium]
MAEASFCVSGRGRTRCRYSLVKHRPSDGPVAIQLSNALDARVHAKVPPDTGEFSAGVRRSTLYDGSGGRFLAQITLPQASTARPRSETERAEIARGLANSVSGEVRFGRHDRMLYATDASMYQVEPIGVVIPDSIEDAVRAVEYCKQHSLPILPRGGGTSLAGQCVSEAVVIDFSPRCTRVIEVDAEGRRCRVEPGIAIDDLNAQLAGAGLFFPPDPATSRHCNIGGAIGNNAAGARSIRYGRTSENLHGVDVCLADG